MTCASRHPWTGGHVPSARRVLSPTAGTGVKLGTHVLVAIDYLEIEDQTSGCSGCRGLSFIDRGSGVYPVVDIHLPCPLLSEQVES